MDTKIIAIRQGYSSPAFSQQGFATLTVALMISFLATFMTFYAAKVGVMEQRIAANEFRAEEAFAAAETGIQQGISYLRSNRRQISFWSWTSCNSEIALPCGNGTENIYNSDWEYYSSGNAQLTNGSYSLYFLKHVAVTAAPVFFIVAKGESADGSGQAFIKQGVYFYPFRINIPDVPLMSVGTIEGIGNLSVVANPNGRGVGVPLSVWASGDVTLKGSATTCEVEKFLSTNTEQTSQDDGKEHTIILCPKCVCPSSGTLSDKDKEGVDIIDLDTTNFPNDVFEYIFGVPEIERQTVKDEAIVLANCDALDETSSGLYWITGDCAPGNNIGSYAAPVLLVVEGNVAVNADLQIFALIFVFSSSSSVKLNGGPTVYGAIISNQDIDLNGAYRMRFDSIVLQNLYNNISGRGLALIPGSWTDY